MAEIFVLIPCASARAYAIKPKGKAIDLEKACKALEKKFEIIAKTPAVLTIVADNKLANVYKDNVMLKGVSQDEARGIGAKIIKQLEKCGALV